LCKRCAQSKLASTVPSCAQHMLVQLVLKFAKL
jgi:hypothetical protein